MKLRLRDNSIRLRFNQKEVQALAEGDAVTSTTPFGPCDGLTCRVIPGGELLSASLQGTAIALHVPAADLQAWVTGSELTLEHVQEWQGGSLKISLEKDLACTHARQGEDDSDAFPNPKFAD